MEREKDIKRQREREGHERERKGEREREWERESEREGERGRERVRAGVNQVEQQLFCAFAAYKKRLWSNKPTSTSASASVSASSCRVMPTLAFPRSETDKDPSVESHQRFGTVPPKKQFLNQRKKPSAYQGTINFAK